MRWLILICTMPLFLSCSDPLGPGPLSGSFEGKNSGVFQKSAVAINNILTWDITVVFALDGTLNWGSKLQNNSTTETFPGEMNIAIYPDSLRTPGTQLLNISNRNFILSPTQQISIAHHDGTSLNPPPTEFYWTLSWGER